MVKGWLLRPSLIIANLLTIDRNTMNREKRNNRWNGNWRRLRSSGS